MWMVFEGKPSDLCKSFIVGMENWALKYSFTLVRASQLTPVSCFLPDEPSLSIATPIHASWRVTMIVYCSLCSIKAVYLRVLNMILTVALHCTEVWRSSSNRVTVTFLVSHAKCWPHYVSVLPNARFYLTLPSLSLVSFWATFKSVFSFSFQNQTSIKAPLS